MVNFYRCGFAGPRIGGGKIINPFLHHLMDIPQIAITSSLPSPDHLAGSIQFKEFLSGIPLIVYFFETPLPVSWARINEVINLMPDHVMTVGVPSGLSGPVCNDSFSLVIDRIDSDAELSARLASIAKAFLIKLPA